MRQVRGMRTVSSIRRSLQVTTAEFNQSKAANRDANKNHRKYRGRPKAYQPAGTPLAAAAGWC